MERFDESLAALATLSPYPLDTRYELRNAAPPDDSVKRSLLESPEARAAI